MFGMAAIVWVPHVSSAFEISPRLHHFDPMSLRENDDIELFLAAQIIRRAS
jgi:hypothetical protein